MDRMRQAYITQRNFAKYRGIEWDLTYADWCELWAEKWHLRGRGNDKYCMARHGDAGPYALWNVSIKTNLANRKEVVYKPRGPHPRRKMVLPPIRVTHTAKNSP